MNGPHPDLGPELRALAQAILDRLDPAVRAGAAMASGGGQAKCQQVWCPVCALAALVNGEQHPLLTVVAEHSVALVTVIRTILDEDGTSPSDPDRTPADRPDPDSPERPGSRYQHIPVSVED
ncbi:hypothetical protein Y900_023400 [Mycolicibacterium aromaticivorans JS19b1 = JCM 16368]|uniref:Uncharacterized protein n=1 Tax=Mycolicibacterium aromaticivorans JS19b1 = JCM 16368 TaxID=1440774 RepID=A0A064CSN0_9MYCO|nr:hypothetical protein [Mycolicibacterium aromaticivorans]KDF01793.1 hypothetical protein Y900_023400 [Mycolicibacterium aromaticivorans JS19b1 = JCM 16368]